MPWLQRRVIRQRAVRRVIRQLVRRDGWTGSKALTDAGAGEMPPAEAEPSVSNHSGCSTPVVGSSGGSVLGDSQMSSTKQHAATKVARAVRGQDQSQEIEARQELATANIEAAIERALATAPPLTQTQVKRLTGLLKGGQR